MLTVLPPGPEGLPSIQRVRRSSLGARDGPPALADANEGSESPEGFHVDRSESILPGRRLRRLFLPKGETILIVLH